MERSTGPSQAEIELAELLKAADDSQRLGYELLSKRKAKQAERRSAVEARLASTLDKGDPRRKLAELKAARSNETAAAFRQRVNRLKEGPTLGKDDWMVSGNVRYDNGRAAAQLTVQVYDRDMQYDDLLGSAITNAYGDFYVIYDTVRFGDEWGNESPDLYVRVLDSAGKILATHERALRLNAGRSEYFEIIVATGTGTGSGWETDVTSKLR